MIGNLEHSKCVPFFSSEALRPQKPYGLLRTGVGGWEWREVWYVMRGLLHLPDHSSC